MFYGHNAFVLAAGQVYFLHMILMDSDSGAAMCLGRTYLVGVDHAEALNGPIWTWRSNRVSRALTMAAERPARTGDGDG